MDYLHKTFTTTMYFFPPFTPGTAVPSPPPSPPSPTPVPASGRLGFGQGGDRVPVKVRWFYCAPNAKVLPYPHAFASSGWDMPSEWNPFVGELHQFDVFPAYARRNLPTTATGQRACGTPEQWANGLAAIPSKPTRYDNQGIPFCCGTQVGAIAVGSIGLGRLSIPSTSAIGFRSHSVPATSTIGLAAVVSATGSIGLVGTTLTVAAGSLGLGAAVPATGSIGLVGTTVVVATGSIGLGAVVLPVGSIGLDAKPPAVGSIGLTINNWVIATGSIGLTADALPVGSIGLAAELPAVGSIGLTADALPVGSIGLAADALPVGSIGLAASVVSIGSIGLTATSVVVATGSIGLTADALPVGSIGLTADALPVGSFGLGTELPAVAGGVGLTWHYVPTGNECEDAIPLTLGVEMSVVLGPGDWRWYVLEVDFLPNYHVTTSSFDFTVMTGEIGRGGICGFVLSIANLPNSPGCFTVTTPGNPIRVFLRNNDTVQRIIAFTWDAGDCP